jgi:Brp/Blh family beta-carotene 15,15'-monooxygenase
MVIQPATSPSIQTLLPTFLVTNLSFIVVAFLFGQPDYFLQILLTLVFVFFIGMPHGALDVIMINKLSLQITQDSKRMRSWQWALLIGGLYLLIAVSAWSAWMLQPAICLVLFLIIAAVHFRHDWSFTTNSGSKFCIALITIALPSLFYSELLAQYFAALGLSLQDSNWIVVGMQMGLVFSLVYLVPQLLVAHRRGKLATWLTALALSAYFLPPLLYFCAYFCAVHSVLHTMKIKTENQLAWTDLAKATLVPMFGTLLLLIVFFQLLPTTQLSEQLLKIIFVGLFALTVPHMLLTAIYEANLSAIEPLDSK